jgi:redox-regulated HSP33 family molecular chaperone
MLKRMDMSRYFQSILTNVRQVTAMYNKLCDEIQEKRKGRTTVSTKIGELLTMSYIKVLSVRKGRGEGGREVELNVSSRRVLEDVLYEDYNLEDLKDFNPTMFSN